MKLVEILNEMPYLHPGEMPRTSLDGSMSVATLNREYTNTLGQINNVAVLTDNDTSSVIGVVVDRPLVKDTFQPLFKLKFKTRDQLEFKHSFPSVRQVDSVAIDKSHSNEGMISTLYKIIVDAGYTIVSDTTQFETAQGLWKKTITRYKIRCICC